MQNVSKLLSGAVLTLAVGNAFAAGSPGVERHTQAFLEARAGGGGQPLETLRGCENIERRRESVSRRSQRNAAAGTWRRSQ